MTRILCVAIVFIPLLSHVILAKPVGGSLQRLTELEDLVKHSQQEFWTILNEFSSQMRVVFSPELSTDDSIPKPKVTDSQPWLNKEDFKGVAIRPMPSKRYLGIDIPDYISTGGKTDALRDMSNKMKAMG